MSLRKPWLVATLFLFTLSSVANLAGAVPNILIWQPPFTASESGEALLADLAVLGEDAVLVGDLFAYSADLSDHEIVMGVVGTTPDTHVINATEGGALDVYVQNGGLLFLEGADCYNYDPEVQGGYNVRPIFGLDLGSDGDGVFRGDIVGIGPLAALGLDFDYLGEPSFLDELNPATSIPILRKKVNQEVHAVFHAAYGNGRAVGFSCEYGGLFDFPTVASQTSPALTMRQVLLEACLDLLRGSPATGIVSVPDRALQLRAFPNPFNPTATVVFSIPRPGLVEVRIYDARGRQVQTLVNGPESAGGHTVTWDSRDETGAPVSSGVYFVRLTFDNTFHTQKIVLLK